MMDYLPWALLLAPLLAAVLNTLLFRRAGLVAATISVTSVLVTLVIAIRLLMVEPFEVSSYDWIRIGDWVFSIGLELDKLSIGMMFVVTFIGTAVHLFSLGYMADDGARGRYFAGLSLFMFSMSGIVLADNFVMMFIFWELVGVSSYLLIGHWSHKNSAADAAKKAFLVNRIGDFGFMIGILMVWGLTGTIFFGEMEEAAGGVAGGALTAAALLVFCGAVGKSAQLPLHVWLPDAMEGPTPVSALIHAATMVAAGVYMLVRVDFLITAQAGVTIAWIGGLTALFAAVIALQQNDIKRVLAYSTLSQLGYMVMAVGLHASEAAMFHLYTHAFFKALLFLGAGAVIHACHHEQDIWKMGGLGRKMPVTFFSFLIGTAALIAFPCTSGFLSKETILYAAQEENGLLLALAVLVAALTPFYMVRLVIVTFFGNSRSKAASKAREVNPVMWAPVAVLAFFSVFAGYHWVAGPLQAQMPEEHHGLGLVFALSLVALIAGAGAAWYYYRGEEDDPIQIKVLARKFYVDEAYGYIVRWLQDFPAYLVYAVDQLLLRGLAVTGSAKATEGLGSFLRRVQSGNLQAYGFLFAIGALALLLLILAR